MKRKLCDEPGVPGQYVKRKKRRENQVSDDSDYEACELDEILDKKVENALKHVLCNEGSVELKSNKILNTAKLIPDFDPENRDMNVKSWIKKIEQLGKIYNWSDETKSFNLQSKLQGQARTWFNRLESYEHTWEEWKSMLIKAFPRYHDYATLLDELMNRKKLPGESMTKYYQEKLAMCYRCQLGEQAAVSCIIRGLPHELQANAQAFQCSTPDALYEGFLSAFDNYQAAHNAKGALAVVRSTSLFRGEASNQPTNKEGNSKRIPVCYRCNESGHVAPNCTLPDKRKCFRCGKIGHVATNCTTNNTSTGPADAVKKVQIISNLNDTYRKTVNVNGTHMKAYVDTGSELNVMSHAAARALDLQVKPTNVFLKGFTGGSVKALGEINLKLKIDEVEIETTAVTTDVDLSDVVLIIGQPVINDDRVVLQVSRNGAELKMPPMGQLSALDAVEEAIRFRIQVAEDTKVPVGNYLLQVNVEGAPLGNVCTKPRQYSMGSVHYALASTILRNGTGYLKVCNFGEAPIHWSKGDTITRAEKCTEACEVSANFFLLKRSDGEESKNCEGVGGVGLDDVCVGEITLEERQKLLELLKKYSDCFATCPKEIGTTNLGTMNIKVTTDKPVNKKPYRLAHSEREIVNKKVDELLEAKIIQESQSEYASPIILVRKANGDYRLCVDYRSLNAITVKERFPLPNIEDQLCKLSGKKVFTNLDLYSGYHHVALEPESIHKTAFVTPDGLYEYLRVPFGLANAPSVFMRVIQKLVKMVGSQELCAFMDDLLLATTNVDEGLCLLERVLFQLRSSDLKLNAEKCSFLKGRVNYLGHDISAQGIRPGERKIEAVAKFPVPTNLHELRQFLGLCSYFRKYVEHFALLAKPLTELTKKSVKWQWNEEQMQSFKNLKDKLCSRPVLALFDQKLPCEIHTDASKDGLAGILLQTQETGELKPVFYFSRSTTREEAVYHSYELETLAVVEALKRFRVYVLGKPVKIVTDCSAVRYTLEKKDLVPRIARWWLMIQEYDLQIEYRPGDRMRHVDALSRNPIQTTLSERTPSDPGNTNQCHVSCVDRQEIKVNIIGSGQIEDEDWFLTVQMQDDKLTSIVRQLKGENASRDVVNNYELRGDRLYRKTLSGPKLVVPALARWKIMQKFHDKIGHVGLKRCEEIIKSDYWFPKMTRFIKKYVRSCLECAYAKGDYGKPRGELHPIPKPNVPMEMVHIDHLGPFSKTRKGYQYILMIVDAFSKFLIARPTKTINSVETVEILKDMCGLFGYPTRIISDRNLAFTSRLFKQFILEHQIHHSLNAVACPRANGQVERFNRTILDAMRTRSRDPNMWTECLPDIVWGINNTNSETTGFHPYELMFSNRGRLLPNLGSQVETVPVTERRNIASRKIKRRAEVMKRQFDKRHIPQTVFKKGDLVLWKKSPTGGEAKSVNTKLQVLYSGPYTIDNVLNNDRYQIKSVKGMRGYKKFTTVVAADSLRPYHGAPDPNEASSDEDVVTRDDLIDLLES